MTCFVCAAPCDDDYALKRYSPLGYETMMSVCAECVRVAFPALVKIEDDEREIERKHQERRERYEAAMEHLRASPTPKEYKRRKQEMIEQGIV